MEGMTDMPSKQGRLLDDDASFAKLKIDRHVPQTWEDGLRLPKPYAPGAYEWWYADAHFSNGYFCIVAHNIQINADGEPCAFIRLDIAKDGKKLSEQKIPVNSRELQLTETHCDVRMGPHFFRSEGESLDRYHIYVDPDSAGGFGIDISLERTIPSYRPGTGRWDVGGKHFSWFCAVPGGRVTGRLFVDGAAIEVEGNGYHDHNWGNVPMDHILSDWLWGRAQVGETTVVAASVRFTNEAGGRETPLLYVTQGNSIVVDAFNDAVTCLEGVKITHPDTGKPTNSDCIYLVDTSDLTASVRFDGRRTVIASYQFESSSEDWEAWYTRFPAKVSVDVRKGDGGIIHAADAGVLENMDFLGRAVAKAP
ncbi:MULTISPECIES: lipocalin-like domain-containing protein [Agrobacterium tumefaciens complex]|uniref:lipocalin-like domain-containing protein n=1 Tax=Agrobacterium tumefaciens complex TaxID=1183400 RepID=UPI001571F874|nr:MULTISPECIES: lipocalin-like domain-containing protein [Agrobacterium tumefaciens complex]NTA19370.1 carotenoid 1,2-hydratase [Agrobacterium tumefaciens]NTB10612.1 carotenoid 1,2-hydratase [Agrobacterium fabrum]WCK74265.1 lipocalin-like domain-containing protein [Agrobacterium tumefaciens]